MWLGLAALDVVASPKSQSLPVIGEVPGVDSSVNWTERGAPPLVGVPENCAVGGTGTMVAVMYPGFVVLSGPAELVAVRDKV